MLGTNVPSPLPQLALLVRNQVSSGCLRPAAVFLSYLKLVQVTSRVVFSSPALHECGVNHLSDVCVAQALSYYSTQCT